MVDIYRALIGAPPEQEEKQAAIADILRRKGAFGMVGQLSGDPVLAQAGQSMQNESQQMAQMLQRGNENTQQFGLEQQRQQQAQQNALTGFDLQRRQLDLTQRGQDIDAAEAQAKLDAANAAALARGAKLTDTQAAAKAYLGRMQAAEQRLSSGKYSPSAADYAAGEFLYGTSGPLTGVLANQVLSKEGKAYFQSAADWVRAKLRKESGAVISPTEMSSEIRTYFPVPGDDADTVAQKAAARKQAEKQLSTMAGQASLRVKVDLQGNPIGN